MDVERYRRANPWIIQNLQNGDARCGRFPNREAAERAAREGYGNVVSVNDAAKIVYVSQMPCL